MRRMDAARAIAWVAAVAAATTASLGAGAGGVQRRGASDRPPNILIVLADDLGYGDVRAFNAQGKIPTPHMDRIARQGMRFLDAHSNSAVCTPTRYGLMTGRYAWRTRLKSGVLWGNGDTLIEPGRLTLPALLKSRGYYTAGVGKWHLGVHWEAKPGTIPDRDTAQGPTEWIDYTRPFGGGPLTAGFDEFFGIPASLDMRDYVYVEGDRVTEAPTAALPGIAMPSPAFYRPGAAGPTFRPERVLADLTQRAVQIIARRSREPRPFFLYTALTSPHTPVLPTAAFAGHTGLGVYGDFVAQTDAAIGELIAALDKAGVADNTIVIIASDNGPAPAGGALLLRAQGHDAAGGWRGAKAGIYEGGHRIPFLVRWPGVVKAGTATSRTIVITDLMATLAGAAGATVPDEAAEDSVSFLPVMRDARFAGPLHEAIVLHSANGAFAIRQGRWKLCLTPDSGGVSAPRPGSPEERDLPRVQLYDLEADPRETTNLQAKHPDVVKKLESLLAQYRASGRSR